MSSPFFPFESSPCCRVMQFIVQLVKGLGIFADPLRKQRTSEKFWAVDISCRLSNALKMMFPTFFWMKSKNIYIFGGIDGKGWQAILHISANRFHFVSGSMKGLAEKKPWRGLNMQEPSLNVELEQSHYRCHVGLCWRGEIVRVAIERKRHSLY